MSFGATADPGDLVTGYKGGLVTDPGAEPADRSPPSAFTPAEGQPPTARARGAGDRRPRPVRHVGPDRHRPDRADALQASRWSAAPRADRLDHPPSLSVLRTCSPDASCGPDPGRPPRRPNNTAPSSSPSRTRRATSAAPAGLAAFNFDNVLPAAGAPLTPDSQAVVPGEPQFEWTRGTDATSGVAGYEVQIRIIDPNNDAPPITTIARVERGGRRRQLRGEPPARRQPGPAARGQPDRVAREDPDVAGNGSNSDWWSLRIDSTIPAAPTITGGPSGPSRDTSPTFTWEGTQVTYKWDVRRAGAEQRRCARARAPPPRPRSRRCRTATTSSGSAGDRGRQGQRGGHPHVPGEHHRPDQPR